MSASASGSGPDKKDPFNDGKTKKEEKEKEEDKKPEEVKKVSPVARFFSSMRVKFTLIIIIYTLLSIVVGCAGALFACLDLYEKTDVLNMEEMVQSIAGGMQVTSNAMIQRGGLGIKQIGNAFNKQVGNETVKDYSILNDTEMTEQLLAKHVHNVMKSTTDASGLFDWKFMPLNLFMLWDENWTQRLAYYRPCEDNSNRRQCILMSREAPFVDFDNGDFRMARKDDIPDYFKQIKDIKPTTCPYYGSCVGIADIPNKDGGPMMYFLSKIPYNNTAIAEGIRGWHVLWGTNMLFFTQIAANRTGLCISGYSSTETPLPERVEKEYQRKLELGKKRDYQLVDPHDSYYDNGIFVATFHQDTSKVTLAQEFTSTTRYETGNEREFCDDTYDHGPEKPRSKSSVFLAYRYFDYVKGELTDKAFMLRMEYHNPICQRSFTPFHAAIVGTSGAWFITVCILVIYFNLSFLVPLEKMRKMRSELIKNALAGVDDDGTLAKEIFGDMVDDNALIDANGDEIRVMLTLQERLNSFYTGLIRTRTDDLSHIKAYYLRRLNAQKVMNFFMCREDEDLYKSLPGLLDGKEVNRHFRRTGVSGNVDGVFLHDLSTARHSFRQFKSILGNEIALEFFKSFCIQRGRSTINSLFFVLDVSWLNQIEEGAKKGNDDFLSNLFSDNMSQGSSSNLASPQMGRRRPEGLVISTNSVSSFGDPETASPRSELDSSMMSPRGEVNRPRHSHFAKGKGASGTVNKNSDTESNPDAAEGSKKIKVPFASVEASNLQFSNSSSSLPSDSEASNGPQPPKSDQAGPAFASPTGDSIAHFIYDSYFGSKSLAQRDLKHSALIGCSKISDYLSLRDGGANVVYSPIMFNNLLTVVVKKIGTDVIPQFLESPTFQIMVYCLILTNYFNKSATVKGKRQRTIDDEIIAKRSNVLLNGIWQACYVSKMQTDDEDDSSSSDSDDDNDEPEEKPAEKEEKKDEESGKADAEDKQ